MNISNYSQTLTVCLTLLVLGKPTLADSNLRGLQTDPPVEVVGNNNDPPSAFPLQRCQGDCDSDKDCDYGLICLQRSSSDGNPDVPGCSGTPEAGEDYCVVPDPGYLVIVGNDGTPSEIFSAGLGACEGDCDDDSDCQTGLKCFKRDGDEPVPGCVGEGYSGTDYCYQPPTITYVGNNAEISSHSLGQCEGDCDDDYDCQYGLVCMQRSDQEVVGCEGSPSSGTDYCVEPTNNQLVLTGNNGSPTEAFEGGLGLCEGDCDYDSDCQPGLKCFQRDGLTPVPGCSGEGAWNSDYCYIPAVLDNVGNNIFEDHELGLCQGDCDSSSD